MNSATPRLTAGDFTLLKQSAEEGDLKSQYLVGGAYLNGNGVGRDLSSGERWLLSAAEGGHAAAQCDLGALYAEGKVLKQNYPEAVKWLRKAAEQGDALAQAGLGSLYGRGFRDRSLRFFQRVMMANASVNRVEAYKWFALALQGGHAAAARDMALLKRLMSPEQIKEAERRIREFIRAGGARGGSR